MFQRRYADNRRGGGVTPIPTGIVSNPVLDPALEGQNLSLTPAVVTSPPPAPTSTYTLYINSAPVVGYVGVSLATLQGYVWQNSDTWLDAYVDETITSPWILGSPVTVSSNTVNVEANSLILLIQTDAGPSAGSFVVNPATTNTQFRFYGNAGSTYDIDWGDGTIQNGVTGIQTRTYASAGTYRIRTRNWSGATIAHTTPNTNTNDACKILELQQWGNTAWTTAEFMLNRCQRMVATYTDAPNLTALTSMYCMFLEATLFDDPVGAPPLNSWDVSGVTNMAFLFYGANGFNRPLNAWDTSSVTNMGYVFSENQGFNQDITGWNTSAVTNMEFMFYNNSAFNQDISSWDVSGVTTMRDMFHDNSGFNQDLGAWVLNNTVNMTAMFQNCTGISTENYSRTLIGWANEWAATGNPINRSLGATGMTYHNTVYGGAPYDNAVSARAALVLATGSGGAGWTISGDVLVP
ncbi:MAG: BspA family leucine-rich repeat surface protein [Bacteroidetes bacterium]|nr:BspA family leucine-rich repeat surface protein [Bacteroidota bacterium]